MNITELMADPTAAAIYASLGLHVPPATLADNYLQAKLSGNTSECLALEYFLRELARSHFHVPEVLAALASMEKHKAMRKPGTGGSKMLREIGEQIRADYAAGRFINIYGEGPDRIRFTIGRLNVTCSGMPGAVELVACKYERGIGKSRSARYGTALA